MRMNLVDLLQDIVLDPSFFELMQSGPDIEVQDFMIGLGWIAGWTILSKIAVRHLRRLLSPLLARHAPFLA